MNEISINKIDKRYLNIAEATLDTDNREDYDVYRSYPVNFESIDYGYIKLKDNTISKMMVASSIIDEYVCNSLFFSEDGSEWQYIDFPVLEATTEYNKLLIYNGSVYFIFDDKIRKLYNFDFENGSMDEDTIEGDISDIAIYNNEVYFLHYNGIYRLHDDDTLSDLVQIASIDYAFSKFINTTNNELVIMGDAEGYPVFVTYDGEAHLIFSNIKCEVQTAISCNRFIYCYSVDSRVIVIERNQELSKIQCIEYPGHKWTGDVYYYHSHFWIAYMDFDDNDMHTYIANSINGINFDEEIRLPHKSDKDGKFRIFNTDRMKSVFCIGAGNTYILHPSINYFDYGKCVFYVKKPVLDNTCEFTIDDFDDVYNFSKYNISVAVEEVHENGYIIHSDIKYEITPRVINGNIYFKIINQDYIIGSDPESEEVKSFLIIEIYGIKGIC